MKVCKRMFLMCILAIMFVSTGFGQTPYWQYVYDANVLPYMTDSIEVVGGGSGSFWISNTDPNAVYLNGDGTLTLNDLVTSGHHYCKIEAATGIWGVPSTIDVRFWISSAITTNNNTPLRIYNGGNYYTWYIYPTYISGTRTLTIDMTVPRVYRIAVNDSGAILYVDINGTVEAVSARTTALTTPTYQLAWGDFYSNQTANMTFDYIYWLVGEDYDLNTTIAKLLPDDCGYWGYFSGDLNKDCYVNFADIAELAMDWVSCTDPEGIDCEHAN